MEAVALFQLVSVGKIVGQKEKEPFIAVSGAVLRASCLRGPTLALTHRCVAWALRASRAQPIPRCWT